MIRSNNFFTPDDAQPTSISDPSVDNTLEKIMDEIHPVDFHLLATPNREKIIESLMKEIQEGQGDETSEVTYEDALAMLNDDKSITMNQQTYKVLFILELLKLSGEIGLPIADFASETRVYCGTHWLSIQNDQLLNFLIKAGEKMGVPRFIALDADFGKKCMKQLQATGFQKKIHSVGTKVNFLNGTLHIKPNGEYVLTDSNPDDMITYVLPYNYDPNATCEIFDTYLNRVLPDQEKRTVLAEFIASCFTNHKHEKVLILYGTGANGKSVLLEVVTALFGTENIGSHTLESLTDKSGYYRGQLGDCLLNYSGEISTHLNADEFKKLASREKISARFPYGRPFTIENYARLAFNCNELPEAEDTSEGFFRRFLIIEFDQYIREEERDRELHKKIINSDLAGVMNWVLAGLQRLTQQGRFSPCASADRLLEKYRREADTLLSFTESDKFDELPNEIKASDLHATYITFCERFGYTEVGVKTFYQKIQRCGLIKKRKADGSYYLKGANAT